MKQIIDFREKVYIESYQSLFRDIKEISTMVVRALNSGGGFPAREPVKRCSVSVEK